MLVLMFRRVYILPISKTKKANTPMKSCCYTFKLYTCSNCIIGHNRFMLLFLLYFIEAKLEILELNRDKHVLQQRVSQLMGVSKGT